MGRYSDDPEITRLQRRVESSRMYNSLRYCKTCGGLLYANGECPQHGATKGVTYEETLDKKPEAELP